MKKLLNWGGVGLLTSALLDPLICSMLEMPVPWIRDLLMLAGGGLCICLLVRFRDGLT